MISATASVGEPPISRLLWYGIGLVAGALSAVAWLAAGRRLARPRLAIAAFGILVPWVFAAPHLLRMTSVDASVVWSLISNMGALAFLASPLLVLGYGLWQHGRRRPMPLAVGGWLVSVALGMVFATTVDNAWTYRPFELFALGLLVSVPGAAAITSPALLAAGSEATPGRVLVIASQTILIGLAGVLAILFGAELARAMLSQLGSFSVDAVAIALVVVGTAALLILGLERWRRGAKGLLVLANGLLLLPTGLYAWLAIDGLGGLFAGSFVTQLLAIALVCIVAVGFFGGLIVQPPSRRVDVQRGSAPAEPQRDEQGGQREEVGGVGDERHGPEVGDRD